MSAKDVRFSTDARDRMLKGINTLANGGVSKSCWREGRSRAAA